MDIPIALFGIFIGVASLFLVVGLTKRIGVAVFMSGIFIFSISIMTDNIILGETAISGNPDTVHYEVSSPAVSNNLNAVSSPIQAEYPSSSSSQLIGDTFDCMSIPMAKTGAPVAGTMVRAGVWGATGNLIKQFGNSLDVQNMPAGLTTYTFCLPIGDTYTIGTFTLIERIGVEYNAGDAVNTVTTRSDNANPFDGTVTFRQQYLAGWASSTGQDLNMKLWLRGDTAEIIPSTFQFTEMIKILFALAGVMLMLVGALYSREL